MKKNEKSKICNEWILKGFIVLTLLFPIIYSPYTDIYQSPYYVLISVPYLMLVVFMSWSLWERKLSAKGKLSFGCIFFVVLLAYNIFALFFNYKYLHWYGEQFNVTIAFLFFLFLICSDIKFEDDKMDLIKFLMITIMVSCLGAIILYFFGYASFQICNNQINFYEMPENFYEKRMYWIYSHKSEFALMLNAFLALFIRFRKKFKKPIWGVIGIVLIYICLVISNSVTGLLVSMCIILGAMLEYIRKMRKGSKQISHPKAVAGAILALVWVLYRKRHLIYYFLLRRNVFSLGGRVDIWRAGLEVIRKYPEGWGLRFSESVFDANGLLVTNAHNVFLNAMLRFSVPVGVCFTILFMGVVIYTLLKGRNFLICGMWAAILAMMTIDYSLMSTSMAMLFLIIYLVCIYKEKEEGKEGAI